MGLSVSPDIFQEKTSELMAGLEFSQAYLVDLLIISSEQGFEKHLQNWNKYSCAYKPQD